MPRKSKATFNAAILFERVRFVDQDAPYLTDAAELNAVATGKKSLARFTFSERDIKDGGFGSFLSMAFDRGLAVILDRQKNHNKKSTHFIFYALPLDQCWRIPALNALQETAFTDGAWSFSAEAQESLLLGYDASQRRRWLTTMRHSRASPSHNTVYALMTNQQRHFIRFLGGHSFGTLDDADGVTFFFHRDDYALKKDALTFVPKEHRLARVSLELKMITSLFGPWTNAPHGVVSGTVSRKLVSRLNSSIRSRIEFLTASGWK